MENEKDLLEVKKLLDIAENKIRQAKQKLFSSEIGSIAENVDVPDDAESVQGIFDGEKMIAKDKKEFQVPPNYASKSKLIPGDVLKLTVSEDGRYLYKQISPIARKNAVGVLKESSEGKYQVDVDGKKYSVLLASVTYFKAKVDDKLSIVLPEVGDSQWAAVDNIV